MTETKSDFKVVLARYQTLCSRKEVCIYDIRQKLRGKINEEDLQKLIDSLLQDGYVNELRYASAYVREKAHINGWGKMKIKFMLRAKGLKDEIIEEAFREIEPQKQEDRLQRLIESKKKSLVKAPHAREKLLRYLISRGYAYDEIENYL